MALVDINFSETVFVFDLDDTLYKEADYQASGFRAILREIEQIYGKNLERELQNLIHQGNRDVLQGLCVAAGLPETVKQSLLWIYRLHVPDICLSQGVKDTISFIRQNAAGVAILTDGRSFSQRSKLRALGLADLPAYISEEYGDEKPSPLRFEAIMRDIPASYYIYIGDNPNKDFIAPNLLGWITIGLLGSSKNVHLQELNHLSVTYAPSVWINCISGMINFDITNEEQKNEDV